MRPSVCYHKAPKPSRDNDPKPFDHHLSVSQLSWGTVIPYLCSSLQLPILRYVEFFLSPSIVVNFSKSQNSSKQEMAIFLGLYNESWSDFAVVDHTHPSRRM